MFEASISNRKLHCNNKKGDNNRTVKALDSMISEYYLADKI